MKPEQTAAIAVRGAEQTADWLTGGRNDGSVGGRGARTERRSVSSGKRTPLRKMLRGATRANPKFKKKNAARVTLAGWNLEVLCKANALPEQPPQSNSHSDPHPRPHPGRQAQPQTKGTESVPFCPLLLALKPTERGLLLPSDTELALLGFQPLSIQTECPSGSMSVSVVPDAAMHCLIHCHRTRSHF